MFLFCFIFTVLHDLEKKEGKRGKEEKREGVALYRQVK